MCHYKNDNDIRQQIFHYKMTNGICQQMLHYKKWQWHISFSNTEWKKTTLWTFDISFCFLLGLCIKLSFKLSILLFVVLSSHLRCCSFTVSLKIRTIHILAFVVKTSLCNHEWPLKPFVTMNDLLKPCAFKSMLQGNVLYSNIQAYINKTPYLL